MKWTFPSYKPGISMTIIIAMYVQNVTEHACYKSQTINMHRKWIALHVSLQLVLKLLFRI